MENDDIDYKLQRKKETNAVKSALKKAGINARVGHGKGTTWGWLKVNIGKLQQFGEHFNDKTGQLECSGKYSCHVCIAQGKVKKMAEAIIYAASKRNPTRDFGDNVNIYTQDHESKPIIHEQFFVDSILKEK